MSNRRITMLAALLALAPVPALAQSGPMPSTPRPSGGVPENEVAAIRAATEKYRDVTVALAEGYIAHPVCFDAPMEGMPKQLGAMGYHYFRPDLVGVTAFEPRVAGVGTHTDFVNPAVLLYEPQQDGSLQLVAIENIVWVEAWREAGNTAPPEFHGNQYYHMVDNPLTEVDEAHGFEPHYELHWYLYRDNPAGEFAPFSTAVSCEHAPAGDGGHGGHGGE